MRFNLESLPIVRSKRSKDLYYYLSEAEDMNDGVTNVILVMPNGRNNLRLTTKADFKENFEVVGPPGMNTNILV